jgi:hypothetical protein
MVALVVAAGAAADGDPASDVLLEQNAFFPFPAPSQSAQQALDQAVAAVYAHGYRVKVAVIASATDLGAVPSLFGKPADYAKFLGTELSFVYVGPLLIAMPAGYGMYDGGRPTIAEDAVLASLHPQGSSAEDLTKSAAAAAGDLLRAGALRSKDILPPYAEPLGGIGRRGRTMKLSYRLYDDSGKASAVLTVLRTTGRRRAHSRVPSPDGLPENGVRTLEGAEHHRSRPAQALRRRYRSGREPQQARVRRDPRHVRGGAPDIALPVEARPPCTHRCTHAADI